jgi:hypothetical protein
VSDLITVAFAEAWRTHGATHEAWIRVSYRLCALKWRPTSLISNSQQVMLSELWVGSTYEFVRLLCERKLIDDTGEVAAIAHDPRLLRVAIKRHEIACDKNSKAQLQLQKRPPKGDLSDLYVYDWSGRKRAHIMPRGICSTNGSMVWQVIDLNDGRARLIERRGLADRV